MLKSVLISMGLFVLQMISKESRFSGLSIGINDLHAGGLAQGPFSLISRVVEATECPVQHRTCASS
jgi:hypothetical protein